MGRSERARVHRRRRGRQWRRAAVGACTCAIVLTRLGGVESEQPNQLVLDERVLTKLQTLADGLHKEIVLCLNGETRNDSAYVDTFTMPSPRLSTATRSSFDACPPGTLASWHNHPREFRGALRWNVSARNVARETATARWLCVLSDTDIRTATRLAHPFVVVSVDGSTWCWWTLEEVERFARERIAPGPPAPDRLALYQTGASWALPTRAGEGEPGSP